MNSFNSIFCKKKIIIFLLVVPFFGCDLAIKHNAHEIKPEESVMYIQSHIDFYSGRLQIGMSKEEVLSYLPNPQNTNSENVCVWASKSTETVVTKRYDWQWLQATRGGYFLIFVDNKLATPLCANAAFDPWEALVYYGKVTPAQAEKILGKKPD